MVLASDIFIFIRAFKEHRNTRNALGFGFSEAGILMHAPCHCRPHYVARSIIALVASLLMPGRLLSTFRNKFVLLYSPRGQPNALKHDLGGISIAEEKTRQSEGRGGDRK